MLQRCRPYKKNIILILSGLISLFLFYIQISQEENIRYIAYYEISSFLGITKHITNDLTLFHLWDYIITIITSFIIYKLLIKFSHKRKIE